MKYEQEPSAAVLVGIIIICILIFLSLLGYAWTQFIGLIIEQSAPTTYHTGLYVESEQVQQTIDGKGLQ